MNKKFTLSFITFLLMLVSVSYFSCVKEMGPLPTIPTTPTQTFCDSANVKFSADINPIIQTKCAVLGCHNASAAGGVNFIPGYSAIDTARIRARVLDGNPSYMPPGIPLPLTERKKIECWLKEGAPNN